MHTASAPTSRAMTAARTATLNRLARVLSGEMENTGQAVKRVILDPRGRACTDGETVWVPLTMDEDPMLNRMMQEAVLAHEAAGHMRYTNFKAWATVGERIKEGSEDALLHTFTNIIEDARVNHLLAQDFPGSGKRLDATQAMFMQKHREQWATTPVTDENARQAAIVAMMTEAIAHEPHFFAGSTIVCDYMDEVRTEMVRAMTRRNTKAAIDSAKRCLAIFRRHFPEDAAEDADLFGMPQSAEADGLMMDDMSPEEIEKMAQQQAKRSTASPVEAPATRFSDLKEKMEQVKEAAEKAAQDAQNGSEGDSPSEDSEDAQNASTGGSEGEDSEAGSEGDSGSPSEDEGEGEMVLGDADGEGEPVLVEMDADSAPGNDSGDADADGDSGDYSDGERTDAPSNRGAGGGDLEDLFSEMQDLMDEEAFEAHRIEKTQARDDAAMMPDIKGKHFADLGDKARVQVTHTTKEMLAHDAAITQHCSTYEAVKTRHATEVSTLVSQMRRLLHAENRPDSGHRTGRLDTRRLWTTQTNDKVFTRREAMKEASVNALILIDASGSMGGRRSRHASEAAVVLTEAMTRIGWNVEVTDFNSGYQDTSIRVRKAMTAPLNANTKAAIAAPYVGSSNGDGYAVSWAFDRLNEFDGHRLLFVISDGQPAGPSPNGMTEDEHLISVVQNAPRDIGLFSIGIDGMDTSRYYPHSATTDAAGLARAVIPVLRTMVRSIKARGA